jgi:hypothetical protein
MKTSAINRLYVKYHQTILLYSVWRSCEPRTLYMQAVHFFHNGQEWRAHSSSEEFVDHFDVMAVQRVSWVPCKRNRLWNDWRTFPGVRFSA